MVLIVLGAIASGYTGVQLGQCWTMLQSMWPEYRKFCRKPYPEIGKRAAGGIWMRFATVVKSAINFCLNSTSVQIFCFVLCELYVVWGSMRLFYYCIGKHRIFDRTLVG